MTMKIIFFVSVYVVLNSNLYSFSINVKDYNHVTFKSIAETVYTNTDLEGTRVLQMQVASSASFLFYPFDKMSEVRGLSLVWRTSGSINISSHDEEKKKSGDDYPLRIGLALSGARPWLPFFAPMWLKMLDQILKLPSDRLLYFVLGSKAQSDESWLSPFSSEISYKSLTSREEGGWMLANYSFDVPYKIVGVWIMADGDQTKSSFITTLKELNLR